MQSFPIHFNISGGSLLLVVIGVVVVVGCQKMSHHFHMGHQDQDQEKVGQMSFFATDREKQKFIHFQVLLSKVRCYSIKNLSFRF